MKITEYPQVSKMELTDVTLIDGEDGTRKVIGADLPFAIMNLCGSEMHRMIYRGKNLGTEFTAIQKTAIQTGTFEDLWLGDYWIINDITWRIIDIDYWYNCGDSKFTSHHAVIMPDSSLYSASMNETDITNGGYIGSGMYISGLTGAKDMASAAFGNNILTHREYLTNAVADGYPSAGDWFNSTLDLPNEIMMYGCHIYASANNGTTIPSKYTIGKTQLALFMVSPKMISNGETFWLRDVVSSARFADVDAGGGANCGNASSSRGVRPVFAIG